MGTQAEFVTFINHETGIARREVGKWVAAGDRQLEVGCVDKLTHHKGKHFNPPGGAAFLMYEGQLQQWVEHRAGKGGGLGIHEFCGYMFVVLGKSLLSEHRAVIHEVDDALRAYNQLYEASFYLVPEHDGGARPFMSNFG